MEPPPAARMGAKAALQPRKTLVRLTSICRFQSASVMSSSRFKTAMPALLTNTSRQP